MAKPEWHKDGDSTSKQLKQSRVGRWRDTPIPNHTIGMCFRCDKCKQFDTDLANGYCTSCWVTGYGSGGQRRGGIMKDEWVATKRLGGI